MPTISVSDEVYSQIAKLARPFIDKEPNDVLERLLAVFVDEGQSESASSSVDLVSHAGRVPHGTELRATYKGREYHALVENGRIKVNGRTYESLSSAAIGVIRSTGSTRPTENGWRFWQAKHPLTGSWTPVSELFLNQARFENR